jgi:hypothetical protein
MNDLTTNELMELRWAIEQYVPTRSELLREVVAKLDAALESRGQRLQVKAFQSEWKKEKK